MPTTEKFDEQAYLAAKLAFSSINDSFRYCILF
jgi:hypothetical protein